MFSKDIQYISAIRYNTQLKIDYKKFHNNEIDQINQSNFLTQDEMMSHDAAFKLIEWQKQVDETYIMSLCLDESQKVVSKAKSQSLKGVNRLTLNQNQDVVIDKERLFESKHYFEKTGIDYLFSPYQIINNHLEQNPASSTLMLLMINSYAYVVILNEKGEIDFSKTIHFSSFENVQESHFYESDVVGQKLYDEIYYLELLNEIKNTLSEYYNEQGGTFVQHVQMLYTVKQLNDEQLSLLANELMIDVKYHAIALSEFLHDFARDKNVSIKSFIKARDKEDSSISGYLVTLILLLAIIFGFYFYYEDEIKRFIRSEKLLMSTPEPTQPKVQVDRSIQLPNHINKNRVIEQHILTFIDSIPYDVILKELEVKKDSASLVVDMLREDTFIRQMQPRYLEIYKYSNMKVANRNDSFISALIYNNSMLDNLYGSNEKDVEYLIDEFMPINRVTEHLRTIFPPDALVTFREKKEGEVMVYSYLVNMVVQNPMQFFEFVEDMNKELYSININYPVLMFKNEDGIEIEFIVEFNQLN